MSFHEGESANTIRVPAATAGAGSKGSAITMARRPGAWTFTAMASRDALTEVLHLGARQLLGEAVEAEVADWIDRHVDARDAAGRRQAGASGRRWEAIRI